jgi:integrase
VVAVTQRRLGPSSSATTSTIDRALPSSAVQLRCWSRRLTAFRARAWRPATRAAGLDGLRIHDLRHTAVALWIAAGANPKEVAARAGHASVSSTLDRYGHLYPEADTALRDRPDVLYGATRPTPEGTVLRLHR